MRLGVRYIAVDHANDVTRLMREESDRHEADAWAEKCAHGCDACPPGRVLVADLDSLPEADATDEQRYQFLEARSQRDAAEADRLAKKLSAEGKGLPAVQTSAFAIRDEEIEVRAVGRPNPGGQQAGVYAGVVAVHRLTGISFLVDDERSQVRNREKAVRRLKETLQPIGETLSEVERLRATCAAMEKVVEATAEHVERKRQGMIDQRWRDVTAAVDAYRKQVPR